MITDYGEDISLKNVYYKKIQQKKFVFWGCGKLGEHAIKNVKGLCIEFFVDKKSEEMKEFFGKRVISPKQFLSKLYEEKYIVIVCASGDNSISIKKQLFVNDFVYGLNVFDYDDFFQNYYRLFSLELKSFLHLEEITFSVTNYCTLKCKDCSFKNPYEKKKVHQSLDSMKNNIEAFFHKIDYIDRVAIVGGECLLWTELVILLNWINDNYCSRYTELRVVSNGTILLSKAVQKCFLENNILFEMTIYPTVDNVIIEKNETICIEKSILYKKIEHEYWLDFGLTKENKYFNRDERQFFFECNSLCRGVIDEKLIYCMPGYLSGRILGFSVEKGYINLSVVNKKDIYKFYKGVADEIPAYCKYCNGFSNAPKINVGEQLKSIL